MDARFNRASVPAQDVYTDMRSLQNLKTEENQDEALKKIAQQFESMFLHEMLKTMRKANEVFEEDSLMNGGDTGFYRDMYDQQLSLSLAQKGTGLADSIYRQLRSQYASQQSAGDKSGLEEIKQKSSMSLPVPRLKTTNSLPLAQSSSLTAVTRPDTTIPETIIPAAPPAGVFESAEDFVHAIMPHAKAAARVLGVNPLLLTAQAALETGWGKFVIRDSSGASTHNLFNIKADNDWSGGRAQVNTLEYQDGVAIKERAHFRSYGSFAESFSDFVEFLKNNPRYEKSLAVAGEDEEFVASLQRAGYATDPLYAEKILAIARQLRADPALAAAQ
jgi:flagellar protein FlgJ